MTETERLRAVLLATIVTFSTLGGIPISGVAAGSAATAGNAGPAPDVVIQNQSIDDSTDTSISISYDATGVIDPNNVSITVIGANFSKYKTPNSDSGTLSVTVPADTWEGGDQAVTVRLKNKSMSGIDATKATDYGILSVKNTSTIANYTVTDEDGTMYTKENVTVAVNVTNTGGSQDTVTVGAYGHQRNLLRDLKNNAAYQKVTLNAGETKEVELNVSFDFNGDQTVIVNDESPTTVPITSRVQYTSHEFVDKSSGQTASDDVLKTNETYYLNFTYENPTSKSGSRFVSYCPPAGCQYQQISVAASGTETVSYEVNFSQTGTKYLWATGPDSFEAYVVNDTTGTPNITLSERQPPATAVEGKGAFFLARATNHGDAAGTKTVNLSAGGSTVDSFTTVLEPGETRYVFLNHSFTSTGEKTVTFGGESVSVTVQEPVVKSATIDYVDGKQPSATPSISAQLSSFGMISVDVSDPQGGTDLSNLGADNTTRFRINVTLTDYEPRILVTSGKNANWTVKNGSGSEKHLVANVTAAQLDFMQSAPRIENWDTVQEDKADFTLESALMMGVTDGNQSGFFQSDPGELDGMTISTDAQVFRPPMYFPGNATHQPSLEIQLAGPHETAKGNLNEGYYEAFLPDSLLSAWGVDSKNDLTAAYSGSQNANLSITKQQNGWELRLDIHYSSGTVQISKRTESSSGSDSTGSTDSTNPSVNVPTSTAITTATPAASATETPTATATATSTATGTPVATETDTTASSESTTVETAPTTESDGQSGFGVVVGVFALIAALVLVTRRR